MDYPIEKWRQVEMPVDSEVVSPGGISIIVRMRIPLPPSFGEPGSVFLAHSFGFMSVASDDPEAMPVLAVSIGDHWVSPSSEGVAHALEMGEVMVVWVKNETTEPRAFSGKIVGVEPSSTPEVAQA